jgi:hypothetical protein
MGEVELSGVLGFGVNAGKEAWPCALWCRSFAHLMRMGLPICVLDKEVVKTACDLASGATLRWRRVAREKDNVLFGKSRDVYITYKHKHSQFAFRRRRAPQ